MGQYYYVVNTDKKEYLYPHKLGDGLKLLEFGLSSCGTMTGLALLLSDGNGRGGGDLRTNDEDYVGRWAGDRIVIAGDYADGGRFVTEEDCKGLSEEGEPVNHKQINLNSLACIKEGPYRDISIPVLITMMDDNWIAETLSKNEGFAFRDGLGDDLQLIKNTKPEDYPTILETLKTDDAKEYVTERIKSYGSKRKRTPRKSPKRVSKGS